MLRGVNVGGHHKIKMDALRALYESLGFESPQTFIQSGNVIFKTAEAALAGVAVKIENQIECVFGFRPRVILRTTAELRSVITRNPFANRSGIDGSKLTVNFLAGDPGPEARDKVREIKADPEELHIHERELYIYFPNGMGQSKLPAAAIDRALKIPGTMRNWNSVLKLRDMAEAMDSRS